MHYWKPRAFYAIYHDQLTNNKKYVIIINKIGSPVIIFLSVINNKEF